MFLLTSPYVGPSGQIGLYMIPQVNASPKNHRTTANSSPSVIFLHTYVPVVAKTASSTTETQPFTRFSFRTSFVSSHHLHGVYHRLVGSRRRSARVELFISTVTCESAESPSCIGHSDAHPGLPLFAALPHAPRIPENKVVHESESHGVFNSFSIQFTHTSTFTCLILY